MASIVTGIDIILSGHTHDALPEPVLVNNTVIVASGSNGKFVSRIDLDVRKGQMMGFKHKLIPIFRMLSHRIPTWPLSLTERERLISINCLK